jgi:hypothetical protein
LPANEKMALFDLKPLAVKILFVCITIFLVVTSRYKEFIEIIKHAPLVYSLFYLMLFALGVVSAGFLAGGVATFFHKIFIKKIHKIDLDLLAGAFSLVTFFAVLIKLPQGCAEIWAFFILPLTNMVLILKFSAWLHADQTLSIPLAVFYGGVMFFCNFSNFQGFLNRFSYWQGEAAASWGILLIFTWPIAIVICISYLLYTDRNKNNPIKNKEQ